MSKVSKTTTSKATKVAVKKEIVSLPFKNFDKEIKECKCCMDDISKDTYAYYQENKDAEWKPSLFCKECITHLLNTSWTDYVDQIKKADCQAALLKLIERGPPINLRDKKAFECDNPQCEVYAFYFGGKVQSAKLKGSLTGIERKEWWDELKEVAAAMNDEKKKTTKTDA